MPESLAVRTVGAGVRVGTASVWLVSDPSEQFTTSPADRSTAATIQLVAQEP